MTQITMAPAEPSGKAAVVDTLRVMVEFTAQRLMEFNVEARCGAGYDEKNPERLNSRSGQCDRLWETGAGAVELRISQLRQGSCFPQFLQPRRTVEKAPTAVMREA